MENNERIRCPKDGCNKEVYKNEEEARAELERILTTQRKLTQIKPCRWYECKCGMFCLTSKPKIETY